MNITERVFDKYLRILSFFVYNKNYINDKNVKRPNSR